MDFENLLSKALTTEVDDQGNIILYYKAELEILRSSLEEIQYMIPIRKNKKIPREDRIEAELLKSAG